MISVIIPTMWKSHRTEDLLFRLNKSSSVDEIILIDNDPINKIDNLDKIDKLKYWTDNRNIYVNPAWNKGVELAKNDLICICNDDTTFDVDSLFLFVIKNSRFLGSIGMHSHNYLESSKENVLYELKTKKVLHQMLKGAGWGTCLFVKKSKWKPIPDGLKIWYGDDWIAAMNGKTYALRTSQKMETEMETTSGRPELSEVVKKDQLYWSILQKHVKNI